MPNVFFPYKITKHYIEKKIEQVRNILKNIELTKTHHVLLLLQQRVNDFTHELLSDEMSSSEKELVLEQYHRFAKTLLRCMNNPPNTMDFINHYHEKFYFPVGVNDTSKPSVIAHDLAVAAVTLGISLAVGSLVAFICNPILGAIMLAVGVTLLFPSCYSRLIPESPGTIKKKEEEKELFQAAAQVINPDLIFNDEDTDTIFEEPGLTCFP